MRSGRTHDDRSASGATSHLDAPAAIRDISDSPAVAAPGAPLGQPAAEELRSLVESAGIALLSFDASLTLRGFTAAAAAELSISARDIGRSISDFLPISDQDQVGADARSVLLSSLPLRRDIMSTDGRVYDARIAPHTPTDGASAGVVVTITDVSERHASNEEQARFAAVARTAHDAIFIASLDGRFLDWNPAAERIFGFSLVESKSLTMSRFVPEEYIAQSLSARARLARGETIEPFESKRISKDGRTIDVWISAAPIFDRSGTPVAIAATVRDITDRNRIEQALRDSESHLQRIADELPLMVWLTDALGLQEFSNRTCCDFFNLNREEMTSNRWQSLLHPDDRERYAIFFLDCVRRHCEFHAEGRFRRHDGQWRWLESWARPRFGPDGAFIGHVGSTADVTDRKMAEEALQRSEIKFRDLLEHAADGIFIADATGHYLEVNKAGCEMLRYSRDEILTLRIPDIIASEETPRVGPELAELQSGRRVLSEWTFRRKDGTFFFGEVTSKELSDGRLIGIVRDITDRRDAEKKLKEAYAHMGRQYQERSTQLAEAIEAISQELASRLRTEQALSESRSRLGAIVHTAAEGIITIDHQGIIDSFNPAAERIFGYAASEIIGKNVSTLMPSPYGEAHDSHIANYVRTGEKKVIGIGREAVGRRKDGTIIPIDLAVSEGSAGAKRFFTGIIRDLTARKEAEHRLRTADRLAAIGTLAAGLGHDMNNVLLPVRARLNALNAAGKDSRIAKPERRHIDEVRKSISYLQQLADGLHFLTLDPDTAEDTRGGGAETDLRQWWSKVGALLSKAVPKHVRVSSSFPRDLPHAAVAAHSLTQAVLNLVVNAGESIPPAGTLRRRQGTVRIWAKAAADKDGSRILVGVTDNGSGMSEEVRRRAFEMFFTTKPRGLGTGLGLPLVHKVAHRVGGRVEIESEPGAGTTVTMILPAVPKPRRLHRTSGKHRAAVLLSDGRAEALIRHVFEIGGIDVHSGSEANRADLWVVEPTEGALKQVNKWRSQQPGGRIVLFGKPGPELEPRWKAVEPLVIENPDDFELIRSVLGRVVSGS